MCLYKKNGLLCKMAERANSIKMVEEVRESEVCVCACACVCVFVGVEVCCLE